MKNKKKTFKKGKEMKAADCMWDCKCDCGNTISVKASDLLSGKV